MGTDQNQGAQSSAFAHANPRAFAPVPAGFARDEGLYTHMGIRLDVVVASALSHHDRVSRLEGGEWRKRILDSPRVRESSELTEMFTLAPGEIWTSKWAITRDFASRLAFAYPNTGPFDGPFGADEYKLGFGPRMRKPLSTSGIRTLNRSMVNAFKRFIRRGNAVHVRPLQFPGKREGSAGGVYRLAGALAEAGPAPYSLAPPDSVFLHPRAAGIAFEAILAEADDDEYVNVLDLVGSAYLNHYAFRRSPGGSASTKVFLSTASPLTLSESYRAIESRRSIETAGRTASAPAWPRRQARRGPGGDHGPFAERHRSVGAWRVRGTRPQPRRGDEAYIVPYIVFDFDRDPEASCEAAQRQALEFLRLGVPPESILCCPTGGRGIHLEVACGAFGTPSYSSSEAAKVALRRTAQALVDEEVDEAVLSPVHLARAVGSGYHAAPRGMSTAEASMLMPQAFKVVIPTTEFVTLPPAAVFAATKEYTPVKLPDPRRAEPVPALVAVAAEAGWRPDARRRNALVRKPASVVAFEKGVERGGRNNAAFVMATFFADQGAMDDDEVLSALSEWNVQNEPPMGTEEVVRIAASASAHVRSKVVRARGRDR